MWHSNNKLAWLVIGVYVTFAASCVLRSTDTFRVLPSTLQYEIQSPDLTRTKYNDVLDTFAPRGGGWIELKPEMGLFIQYALFREGSTEHSIENYLGTESMRYEVKASGELAEYGEISRMEPRPRDTLPVDRLVSKEQRGKKHHRFFFQVVIYTPEAHRVAALISSDSPGELESLTEKLQSGASALEDVSPDHYAFLPETASAAVELSFIVNGTQTRAIWGKRLSSVVGDSRQPRLLRLYEGKWRRVNFDPEDREALELPLLPGDQVEF